MLKSIIGEIEKYLRSPMRDAEDWWEQEERITLCNLLVQLTAQRDRAGAVP